MTDIEPTDGEAAEHPRRTRAVDLIELPGLTADAAAALSPRPAAAGPLAEGTVGVDAAVDVAADTGGGPADVAGGVLDALSSLGGVFDIG
jgi:hypothetical protein